PCGFRRCDHLEPELLIAIKNQVFVRGFKWKRFAQLLDDPSARRMLRDVNLQDAPPLMTDDKEAVEHAERNRWHSERNPWPQLLPDGFEGRPASACPLRVSRCSFHPTGDRSLGKCKTEHAAFPMNSRRSPRGVLNDQAEDQFPTLLRRRSPSDLPPNSGDQPPVHTNTHPVPADDGFGRHDEEGLLPSRAH